MRAQTADARLTLTEAALRANVSKQLVLYWTTRQHNPLPRGKDGRVRLEDLLEVERETRMHRNSHRGVQPKAA
jgi:hypothetical protein